MAFNSLINTGQVIPNYRERKQLIYRDPKFLPNTILLLDTANITSGTISNPTWLMPTQIRGAYAFSLKSLQMNVSWYNVLVSQTITVTYGANPNTYPTTITIPAGRYDYNNYIGHILQ